MPVLSWTKELFILHSNKPSSYPSSLRRLSRWSRWLSSYRGEKRSPYQEKGDRREGICREEGKPWAGFYKTGRQGSRESKSFTYLVVHEDEKGCPLHGQESEKRGHHPLLTLSSQAFLKNHPREELVPAGDGLLIYLHPDSLLGVLFISFLLQI